MLDEGDETKGSEAEPEKALSVEEEEDLQPEEEAPPRQVQEEAVVEGAAEEEPLHGQVNSGGCDDDNTESREEIGAVIEQEVEEEESVSVDLPAKTHRETEVQTEEQEDGPSEASQEGDDLVLVQQDEEVVVAEFAAQEEAREEQEDDMIIDEQESESKSEELDALVGQGEEGITIYEQNHDIPLEEEQKGEDVEVNEQEETGTNNEALEVAEATGLYQEQETDASVTQPEDKSTINSTETTTVQYQEELGESSVSALLVSQEVDGGSTLDQQNETVAPEDQMEAEVEETVPQTDIDEGLGGNVGDTTTGEGGVTEGLQNGEVGEVESEEEIDVGVEGNSAVVDLGELQEAEEPFNHEESLEVLVDHAEEPAEVDHVEEPVDHVEEPAEVDHVEEPAEVDHEVGPVEVNHEESVKVSQEERSEVNHDEPSESNHESLEVNVEESSEANHEQSLEVNNDEASDVNPEESMEVDAAESEVATENDGTEINGMNSTEAEGEDEDELNDEEGEANPEEVVNGSLSEGKSLPQCRLKRNYRCVHCGINTQNPRKHLYHLRDEHGERMKVFECPRCIYASKNHQKLIRHAQMVHKLKIKRLDSSSPTKRLTRSPRAKTSPVKSTRSSMSPGKSSPGKSPRSYDDFDEMDDEDSQHGNESPAKSDEKKLYSCEHCDYACRSRKLLNRHETTYHLKRKFFRCVKCNYVTHLKGRYTKHMKYHQLPILKCDYCDFRTPYRWNLDRHLRNHTEECGEYRCHMCNFTAQIKQSLTVHISNHHLTADQIRERESRRTIGISDPNDCTSDEQENELLRLERDEHPDALILPGFDSPGSPSAFEGSHGHHNGSNRFRVSNIDMGNQDESQVSAEDSKNENGEPSRKKPKIKITLKKMKLKGPKDTFFQELNERHNFEEDFIHPDDVVHRHGNVYIKTFKCHYCSFKAAFKNEVARHEKKIHSVSGSRNEDHAKKAKKSAKCRRTSRRSSITSGDDVLSQILQYTPADSQNGSSDSGIMDALEKLNNVESSNADEQEDKSSHTKLNTLDESRDASREDSVEPSEDQSSDSKESSPSKDLNKKKGQSFFEKLQEKMPTSNVQNLVCQFCGHESKCLSESVRHQKLHLSAKNIGAPASLSTRCQFCRHRCKTTDDLINHLKLCPEARKNQITDSGRRPSGGHVDENEDSLSSGKGDAQTDETDDAGVKKDGKLTEADGQINIDDDEKHPMENRVFVWNNFKLQEENAVEEKVKISEGTGGKVSKQESSSVQEMPEAHPGDKSPVSFEIPLDYIESPTPQGHHYYSKRVYRCPQCSFWATTASRFHVHIVGHFNRKPYNCSECNYKSNWRWDITKHIKLKVSRDNSHHDAQVIITDETGEKNYGKYECYLSIIQLDETNAHRTEGGIPTRKGRPKHTPEKEEGSRSATPAASPVRKPPMVTIPGMPRLQGLPRLTRAPGRSSTSQPGPMPFGPILPGAQMMVQMAGSGAASGSPSSRPPPPLSLRGMSKPSATTPTSSSGTKISNSEDGSAASPAAGGQYQIITPQGAVNTSLETLHQLASGSTDLCKLKKQLKVSVGNSEESQAALTHQVSVSSTGEDGKEVAKMVLDHEGNPEWKCNSCDFRDSERETILQHVRLAHARNGPVSLLHAVHRCDVCGFAAGTKRAVQLHIDNSHGGQAGITSRCEGQNPEEKDCPGEGETMEYSENARTFQCRLCPYTCKKRSEIRPHLIYHTARPDCIFKCMFCPYYVPTKGELFEHLSVHGMEVPASVLDVVNKGSSSSTSVSSSPVAANQDEGGVRQFECGSCPFESRSRSKLMHHRQFHKPKGLPFRCPHCTYNVTRRHLLSQHIRVHGGNVNLEVPATTDLAQVDDRSNSPSPSLTITPVTNAATSGGDNGEDSSLTDASHLPKLTDAITRLLDDIPLVWVSRDNRFFKMFKCRHCPHVNLRKTNIQEHEKMHKTEVSKEAGALHCPNCSYVSVNAGVMSAHMKVHGGSMGQCHAVVDPTLSDEDQLRQLTSRSTTNSDISRLSSAVSDMSDSKQDEKVLYYCQQCPARFFFLKEIQIHSRFHSTDLPHTCDHCNYGARQSAHLLAHLKVHTPEYQQRTRTMMSQHRTAATHPPVPGLSLPLDVPVNTPDNSGCSVKDGLATAVATGQRLFSASPPPTSVVPPQPPPTSKYMCDQCPASFTKLITLQYHQSLHGAQNPHMCSRCSYAGKTSESLQQHMQLHTQYDENCQAEKAAKEAVAAQSAENRKTPELTSKFKNYSKNSGRDSSTHPPIKLKLIGLRPGSSHDSDGGRPQFKYYVEEQVPLSGVDLLRRKTQLEKEEHDRSSEPGGSSGKNFVVSKHKSHKELKEREDLEESDPKRIGDPKLYYPLHIDKVTGKSREKRYKCNKCPSAFEKIEQYNVHGNLHGSRHKYKCRICDYSVKFYANFMMHINRHKYHERMVSQTDGTPLPVDTDQKYEPIISSSDNLSQGDKGDRNKMEDLANKENLEEADMTTSERQHLLLQNKKGVADPSRKDEEKERKIYYCQYCPYANIRRDAVDSHSLRHHANGGYGTYKCTYCDYTASQPNFIREHTKVHFRPFKYVHPEGFMRHDRQEIFSVFSTSTLTPGSSANDKHLIFSFDNGVYKPVHISNTSQEEVDSPGESGIKVNFRSGDVVEAPNDFVISLRPPKSKGFSFVEPPDQLVSNSEMETTIQGCENIEAVEHQEDKSVVVENEKLENMEVDCTKNSEETETDVSPPEPSSFPDHKEMEIDPEPEIPSETSLAVYNHTEVEVEPTREPDVLQNEGLSLTNGHTDGETQDLTVSEETVDEVQSEPLGDASGVESVPLVTKTWSSDQPEQVINSH